MKIAASQSLVTMAPIVAAEGMMAKFAFVLRVWSAVRKARPDDGAESGVRWRAVCPDEWRAALPDVLYLPFGQPLDGRGENGRGDPG